jgi:hypothetical protein
MSMNVYGTIMDYTLTLYLEEPHFLTSKAVTTLPKSNYEGVEWTPHMLLRRDSATLSFLAPCKACTQLQNSSFLVVDSSSQSV